MDPCGRDWTGPAGYPMQAKCNPFSCYKCQGCLGSSIPVLAMPGSLTYVLWVVGGKGSSALSNQRFRKACRAACQARWDFRITAGDGAIHRRDNRATWQIVSSAEEACVAGKMLKDHSTEASTNSLAAVGNEVHQSSSGRVWKYQA